MVDQCDKFKSLGMSADYVGETQDDRLAIERIVSGKTQLVFISPEAIINNQRYREMLLSSVYEEKLVAVAIDEAYLVKEWLEYKNVTFTFHVCM